jgi:hypothetical protein
MNLETKARERAEELLDEVDGFVNMDKLDDDHRLNLGIAVADRLLSFAKEVSEDLEDELIGLYGWGTVRDWVDACIFEEEVFKGKSKRERADRLIWLFRRQLGQVRKEVSKEKDEEIEILTSKAMLELPPPLPKKDYTRCPKCSFQIHLPHSGLVESNKKWQEDWETEFKKRVAANSKVSKLTALVLRLAEALSLSTCICNICTGMEISLNKCPRSGLFADPLLEELRKNEDPTR